VRLVLASVTGVILMAARLRSYRLGRTSWLRGKALPGVAGVFGPGGVVVCRAGQRFFSFLTPSRHICWKMPGVPTVVSTPAVLRT
jgi:hypothetical protein